MTSVLGPRVVRCRVRREDAGAGMLGFLVQRFTYHSPEEWVEILAAGRVLLNGVAANGKETLSEGDALEYRCGDLPEPDVPQDAVVLHEDADLLVVAKPAGLPVHPAGRYFRNTLWAVLRERGYDGFHFVSRLDRETSGLLLVARNPAGAKHFQALAAEGRIGKAYLVAVEGEFPEAFHACGWLAPDAASCIRKKRGFFAERPDVAGEQTAETQFACLARHGGISLLRAELVTGRTHQIRATLCSLGFPVVGDKIYGRDETLFLRFRDGLLADDDRAALRLPHQALHSWQLVVREEGEEPRRWTCPPPDDLLALFPSYAPVWRSPGE